MIDAAAINLSLSPWCNHTALDLLWVLNKTMVGACSKLVKMDNLFLDLKMTLEYVLLHNWPKLYACAPTCTGMKLTWYQPWYDPTKWNSRNGRHACMYEGFKSSAVPFRRHKQPGIRAAWAQINTINRNRRGIQIFFERTTQKFIQFLAGLGIDPPNSDQMRKGMSYLFNRKSEILLPLTCILTSALASLVHNGSVCCVLDMDIWPNTWRLLVSALSNPQRWRVRSPIPTTESTLVLNDQVLCSISATI